MKLIFLDGAPASGKNTLGELLVAAFHKSGAKATLLDQDTYVEQFNPRWVWDSEGQKEKDLLEARINLEKDINRYLREDFIIVVIGVGFLRKSDLTSFIKRLDVKCPVYLYHLNTPFAIREQRLHQRGPHSLIDSAKHQRDRDAIKEWPGYVYENINSPQVDASNLMSLIEKNAGLIHV